MFLDPTSINWVMNTLQAASYLGVSPEVVDAMIGARTIPAMRVGDRWIFSKAALDHWIYSKSMENLEEDLPPLGFGSLGPRTGPA
jgi:excisionase family DNA binding protein